MESIMEIVGNLEAAGLVTLFGMIMVKFILGVVTSIQEKTFEWSKFGNILKDDLLKYVVVIVLMYMYREPTVTGPVMAVFGADISMGILKNIGRMFPNVAEALPNSVINTEEASEITIVEK